MMVLVDIFVSRGVHFSLLLHFFYFLYEEMLEDEGNCPAFLSIIFVGENISVTFNLLRIIKSFHKYRPFSCFMFHVSSKKQKKILEGSKCISTQEKQNMTEDSDIQYINN